MRPKSSDESLLGASQPHGGAPPTSTAANEAAEDAKEAAEDAAEEAKQDALDAIEDAKVAKEEEEEDARNAAKEEANGFDPFAPTRHDWVDDDESTSVVDGKNMTRGSRGRNTVWVQDPYW